VAPVLLCPECGAKHPLDDFTSETSFPCGGCGRTLKVPAQAREMSAAAASDATTGRVPVTPAPAPAPRPAPVAAAVPAAAAAATAVPAAAPFAPPPNPGPADLGRPRLTPAAAPGAADGSLPPVWVRVLLWIVAVPLAFLVVFALARAFGFLATNDITDIALAQGWHRYWPIVRLLPFVALVTALFVTGGVYGIARLLARDESPGASGSGSTPRRPPPRQSSRAGA